MFQKKSKFQFISNCLSIWKMKYFYFSILRQTSSYRKLTPDPPPPKKRPFFWVGAFFRFFSLIFIVWSYTYGGNFMGLKTLPWPISRPIGHLQLLLSLFRNFKIVQKMAIFGYFSHFLPKSKFWRIGTIIFFSSFFGL